MDDDPPLAQQGIDDRTFADIGPTHDAQRGHAFLARNDDLRVGERRHDHVQQVTDPKPVLGGDRDDVTQAQAPEPLCQQFGLAALALVGDHDHGDLGGAQVVGDLEIARRRRRRRVDDEQRQIGVGDCLTGLVGNLAPDRRRVLGVDATRVDQLEGVPGPVGPRLTPVTGHARERIDHGAAGR